jgi:hypothetical protein
MARLRGEPAAYAPVRLAAGGVFGYSTEYDMERQYVQQWSRRSPRSAAARMRSNGSSHAPLSATDVRPAHPEDLNGRT